MPNDRERLPLPEPVAWLEQRTLSGGGYDQSPIVEWWATRNPSTSKAPRKNLHTADQMREYSDACNAALREQVRVLREALRGALDPMDRARDILTDGKPRPECNWGMLATESARAALEATK